MRSKSVVLTMLILVAFATSSWAQMSGIANNVFNGNYVGRVSVGQKVAASFRGVRGAITGITVNLSKVGTPGGEVLVEVRDGSYSGTVLASSTIGGGQIPSGSYSDVSVSFARVELVSAANTYYVVFSKTSGVDNSNYFLVGCGNSGSVFGEVTDASWALMNDGGWTGHSILGAPKISFNVLPAGTAPASVQTSASSLDFSNVNVAATVQRVLRVLNVGGSPLTVTGVASNSSEFTFTPAVPPNATVAVGDSMSISVSLTPTSAGSKSGTLTITHNAPGLVTTVAMVGTGVATGGGGGTTGGTDTTVTPPVTSPGVTITPTTLTMDSTVVGFTSQKTFIVRNDSAATLQITGVTVTSANSVDFQVIPGSATVESTGSRTFIVSFTPSATGTRQAEIRITHNAAGGVSTIPVSGRGAGASTPGVGPQISVSPSSVIFDTTATNGFQDSTVTVTNTGTSTLFVTGIMVTGHDPSNFSVSPTSFSIAPGAHYNFNIRFHPANIGGKDAVVVVGSNAINNNAVNLPVRGNTPIDRRRPNVSLAASVTRGFAPLTVKFVNHNAGGAVNRWEWNMNDRTNVGTMFIIRYSQGDTITYTFTQPGVYDPRLTVDGPGGADSRTLSESSGRNSIIVYQPQPPAPELFADADSLNLGTIDVGATTTSSFHVRNRGNAVLSARLTMDGDNSFVITSSDSFNVAADSSDVRTVSVRFLPLSAGTKTARLVIRYNGDPGTRTVYLTAVARPVVDTTAPPVQRPIFMSSIDSVYAGRIVANHGRSYISFLVRNTGTARLNANVFFRGNRAYTVTPDSLSLAPGASDSVRIVFAPTMVGPATGRIYFNHNGGIEPDVVDLKGEGIAFVFSVQTADFDGNGLIDLEDFFILADQLNRSNTSRNVTIFDITGDGTVDYDDFYLFADYFGQEVPR